MTKYEQEIQLAKFIEKLCSAQGMYVKKSYHHNPTKLCVYMIIIESPFYWKGGFVGSLCKHDTKENTYAKAGLAMKLGGSLKECSSKRSLYCLPRKWHEKRSNYLTV